MKSSLYPLILTSALTLGTPFMPSVCITAAAETTLKQADSYKAMLNVFTYDSTDKLIGNGTAAFINERGEVACAYSLFNGASRAEAVDWKGNRYAVHRILGANRDYDLIRFSLTGVKKFEYLPIASTESAEGSSLQLVHYTSSKKTVAPSVNVVKAEAYSDFKYYTVSAENVADNFGTFLVNENGELVGIVQKNVGKDAQTACAIDARFIDRLQITAMSAFSTDLRAVNIQKAVPTDVKDALSYLYMMPQSDTLAITTAYADFISAHPDVPDGYMGRASVWAAGGRYAEAEADVKQALSQAEAHPNDSLMSTDNVHYQFSNLIYHALNNPADSAATAAQNWTYARALAEAEAAYQSKPLTLYLNQEGNCLFAQKDYDGAYRKFLEATKDQSFASPETYYCAARALELAKGDDKEVVALLDSAVNRISQPINARNAQYYLERSQRLLRVGRYRDAVMDYNEYEKAIGPRNLNAQFYFLRHEAEMEAHMYQQALDDIRTAISTSAQPLPYRLEEAYVLLRVGEFKDAIDAATKLLRDLPENPDCYKIIGISYGELGKKALAQQNLQKAKSLGDDTVDTFIQKYK